MTRQQYISRTLKAMCGLRPASPDEYYKVARMADDVERVMVLDHDNVTDE